MANFILLSGNPFEPLSTDVIVCFDSLPVGQPIPAGGWRVLSGNATESQIARVCYRYEVESE